MLGEKLLSLDVNLFLDLELPSVVRVSVKQHLNASGNENPAKSAKRKEDQLGVQVTKVIKLQQVSETRTSMDFRPSTTVRFSNSLAFSCMKLKKKSSVFKHIFFKVCLKSDQVSGFRPSSAENKQNV